MELERQLLDISPTAANSMKLNFRAFSTRSQLELLHLQGCGDKKVSNCWKQNIVVGQRWQSQLKRKPLFPKAKSVVKLCLLYIVYYYCPHGSDRLNRFHRFYARQQELLSRLSHRNSVRLSVCLSVTRVDQAKTVQARIIKSSPSAAPNTLVSGSVTLFQKFHRGHPNRGP